MQNIENRRKLSGITITPLHSSDSDFAIYLEKTDKGWIVQASIVDIASSVPIGTRFDLAASEKAFTYNISSEVTSQLLPRSESDKFSLSVGKESLTITVSIYLSNDLEVLESTIELTCFSCTHRFSYSEVGEIVSDKDHEPFGFMKQCYDLARALFAKRLRDGATAIYDIESGWMTNEEGILVKICSHECCGRLIVQEFEILANAVITDFCVQNDIRIIFRNHSDEGVMPDSEELIEEMYKALAIPNKFSIQEAEHDMNLVMDGAVYSLTAEGHYGFSLAEYAHFTWPFGRYVDWVNQRIIVSVLKGEKSPYSPRKLEEIVEYCMTVERQLNGKNEGFNDEKRMLIAREKPLEKRLSNLEDSDFHQILRIVLGKRLPIDFEAEISNRLDSSSLPLEDICLILLIADREWNVVKEKALSYLIAHPDNSVSVFEIARQKYGLNVSYQTNSSGFGHLPRFTSAAKISIDGKLYVSPDYSSTKKKESQQHAATSLLGVINGIVVKILPAYPQKIELHETEEDCLVTENFIGRLYELCSQNDGWTTPDIVVNPGEGDDVGKFVVRASVNIDGVEYASKEFININKKQAKQLAAGNLISKIEHLSKTEKEKETIVVSDGNYVGALQEFCQKEGYGLPRYSDPVATETSDIAITCTIKIGTDVISAEGKATKSAKIAKQKAAEKVLDKIKNRIQIKISNL